VLLLIKQRFHVQMKWGRSLWHHFCCHGNWCKLHPSSQPEIARNLANFRSLKSYLLTSL